MSTVPTRPSASRATPARPTPVVLFHLGRSGSTVLCDLLGRHPEVTWDKEPFLEVRQKGRSHPLLRPRAVRWLVGWLPPEEPLAFVQACRGRARTRYHGIDVKPFHLARCGLSGEAFVRGTEATAPGAAAYVLLTRRNTLRKVVSSLVMRSTGRTHVPSERAGRLSPVHLPVDRLHLDGETRLLVDFLAYWDRAMADLETCLAGRHTLRLTYEEDLAADPLAGYRRVCAHLGIEAIPLRPRFARTTPGPIASLLQNVDEVRGVLRGTPWEWMLDEEQAGPAPRS